MMSELNKTAMSEDMVMLNSSDVSLESFETSSSESYELTSSEEMDDVTSSKPVQKTDASVDVSTYTTENIMKTDSEDNPTNPTINSQVTMKDRLQSSTDDYTENESTLFSESSTSMTSALGETFTKESEDMAMTMFTGEPVDESQGDTSLVPEEMTSQESDVSTVQMSFTQAGNNLDESTQMTESTDVMNENSEPTNNSEENSESSTQSYVNSENPTKSEENFESTTNFEENSESATKSEGTSETLTKSNGNSESSTATEPSPESTSRDSTRVDVPSSTEVNNQIITKPSTSSSVSKEKPDIMTTEVSNKLNESTQDEMFDKFMTHVPSQNTPESKSTTKVPNITAGATRVTSTKTESTKQQIDTVTNHPKTSTMPNLPVATTMQPLTESTSIEDVGTTVMNTAQTTIPINDMDMSDSTTLSDEAAMDYIEHGIMEREDMMPIIGSIMELMTSVMGGMREDEQVSEKKDDSDTNTTNTELLDEDDTTTLDVASAEELMRMMLTEESTVPEETTEAVETFGNDANLMTKESILLEATSIIPESSSIEFSATQDVTLTEGPGGLSKVSEETAIPPSKTTPEVQATLSVETKAKEDSTTTSSEVIRITETTPVEESTKIEESKKDDEETTVASESTLKMDDKVIAPVEKVLPTLATFEVKTILDTTVDNSTESESAARRRRALRDPGSVDYPDISLQLQNGMYGSHVARGEALYAHLPKHPFLVDGATEELVPVMSYTSVFPFAFIPRLHAQALEFPLDDERYKLLLILPVERRGLRQLIYDLSSCPLREVYRQLKSTRVHAVIPSFMVEGFVILTSTLQQMGIWDVFDPRRSNLSGMSTDPELYVRNIEQAITVVIRNYVEIVDIQTRTMAARSPPERFQATHPFLYFVMDTETHVALMAGKIVDPLNSRIY